LKRNSPYDDSAVEEHDPRPTTSRNLALEETGAFVAGSKGTAT
jgi:hypothetical protein